MAPTTTTLLCQISARGASSRIRQAPRHVLLLKAPPLRRKNLLRNRAVLNSLDHLLLFLELDRALAHAQHHPYPSVIRTISLYRMSCFRSRPYRPPFMVSRAPSLVSPTSIIHIVVTTFCNEHKKSPNSFHDRLAMSWNVRLRPVLDHSGRWPGVHGHCSPRATLHFSGLFASVFE